MDFKKEATELIQRYFDWLKYKTHLRAIDENWVEITTPYLDRHNDYLQIYLKKEGEGLLLSDDGYTIEDLVMSGCDVNSSQHKQLLHRIVTDSGVKINEQSNELTIHSSIDEFPFNKHIFIKTILSVNNLFYFSRSQN